MVPEPLGLLAGCARRPEPAGGAAFAAPATLGRVAKDGPPRRTRGSNGAALRTGRDGGPAALAPGRTRHRPRGGCAIMALPFRTKIPRDEPQRQHSSDPWCVAALRNRSTTAAPWGVWRARAP